MYHGKPLYVALAQRKEDRKAQLQLQYAQQLARLSGPSTAIIPSGYPPYYYAASGVISHVPPRAGLMYQHLALRPGWGANGFAPPARSFQQSPVPAVSDNFVYEPKKCLYLIHFFSTFLVLRIFGKGNPEEFLHFDDEKI